MSPLSNEVHGPKANDNKALPLASSRGLHTTVFRPRHTTISNDLGVDTTDTQARKWWSDSDDLSLLTQVKNDLPFKQVKNTTKLWHFQQLAAKLLEVPRFGRTTLDGKAANRYYQLLRPHRRFQHSFKYLSGVEQDETGKIVLLDELIQLFDEATDQGNADRVSMHAKMTEKEAAASFIRDQAMQSGKRKSVETDECYWAQA
ncbi:hypothetical protein H257_03379 [Aphanomyces astaci]|uniref:Uncharacterized protein n=1 Tax=Aphanomyces astaci TaxID=112090 RepID=W4GWB8_APHAT|nr:hypothetical protein H257_03379 [Aphanomyces astaci]ETV84020.1 hypothetical protein H257_03379 [Aphanomyces astaci]|eukprot:XP_009825712.1 hypothetical protein H257_03379 [Aphanomyces astaci]